MNFVTAMQLCFWLSMITLVFGLILVVVDGADLLDSRFGFLVATGILGALIFGMFWGSSSGAFSYHSPEPAEKCECPK